MSQIKRKRRMKPVEIAEEVLLQPWFLPQKISFKIHGMVPPTYWRKMRHVFDDYGCLICGSDSEYHSCGLCSNCYGITRSKVLCSAKRHAATGAKLRLDVELFRQEKLAKKLLARFAVWAPALPDKRRFKIETNPVYEALASRYP